MTGEGFHTVTPRLFVDDPTAFIDFLKRTFYATGEVEAERPSEITIGDSLLMIAQTGPREATRSVFYVYVGDVDTTYARALEAGASAVEEPELMPWGDRRGIVTDAFGNDWQIAEHGK